MNTKHEGLSAAHHKRRAFYYHDEKASERRIVLIKRNTKFKRLNALLDLGVKL